MKVIKRLPLKPRGRTDEKKHTTRDAIREAYTKGPRLEVQVIPAKRDADADSGPKRLRVCAYCRVSTDEDSQGSSYELQVQNYTQMIQSNPNWEFAGIYADEGISGTSVLHREHFLEMIDDCKAGKIDLVITKQVSRFARNVLDSLSYIRLLRSLDPPVGILFETEGLNTLDSASEMTITVLSLVAQSESEQKSKSIKWAYKRRWSKGVGIHPNWALLGYELGEEQVYNRYTDLVEPYGMDECFIDISGSQVHGGDPMAIAEEIRSSMRDELGLTVSIGVSYNKIFAKLGSDMKKPDAITEITPANFKQRVWPLPASDLLYVGRSTTKKLADRCIYTIGNLAAASPEMLRSMLGVNGVMLWNFANGNDTSRVMHKDFVSPVKSIGHGITCNADLVNDDEVDKVILFLCQDIGHKLRIHDMRAQGVQICIRDCNLWWKQYQAPLLIATQSSLEIAVKARELFHKNYKWSNPLRSITVRAIRLSPKANPVQQMLFDDGERRDKAERLEDAVDDLRRRFGKSAILPASIMGELKIPGRGIPEITMPGMMYM